MSMQLLRRLPLLTLLLLSPAPVSGAIVPPPSFEELVDQAEAIFVGTVVHTRARWVDSPRGEVIATVVTFEVGDSLKGALSPLIELEFLGGAIGDLTFGVPGVPSFVVGEQAVIFAYTRGLHVSPIVGVMHGRFRVSVHPVSGERFVTTHDGLAFSNVRQLGGRVPRVSPRVVRTMRLDDFKAEIARRAQGPR